MISESGLASLGIRSRAKIGPIPWVKKSSKSVATHFFHVHLPVDVLGDLDMSRIPPTLTHGLQLLCSLRQFPIHTAQYCARLDQTQFR